MLKNQAFECFKIAYSSILAHKLRSILTMLGIIIGIASVVCVVALGLGSQAKVLESIARLGTNTIESVLEGVLEICVQVKQGLILVI